MNKEPEFTNQGHVPYAVQEDRDKLERHISLGKASKKESGKKQGLRKIEGINVQTKVDSGTAEVVDWDKISTMTYPELLQEVKGKTYTTVDAAWLQDVMRDSRNLWESEQMMRASARLNRKLKPKTQSPQKPIPKENKKVSLKQERKEIRAQLESEGETDPYILDELVKEEQARRRAGKEGAKKPKVVPKGKKADVDPVVKTITSETYIVNGQVVSKEVYDAHKKTMLAKNARKEYKSEVQYLKKKKEMGFLDQSEFEDQMAKVAETRDKALAVANQATEKVVSQTVSKPTLELKSKALKTLDAATKAYAPDKIAYIAGGKIKNFGQAIKSYDILGAIKAGSEDSGFTKAALDAATKAAGSMATGGDFLSSLFKIDTASVEASAPEGKDKQKEIAADIYKNTGLNPDGSAATVNNVPINNISSSSSKTSSVVTHSLPPRQQESSFLLLRESESIEKY